MADMQLADIELPAPLVLLVDDVPENAEMLYRILKDQEYRFAVATNVAETFMAVGRKIPDLILLDVMLPDGDGFSVAEELRKKYPDEEIPIIFITARANIDDKIKGFSVGGIDYIPKPFHNREVLLRVRTHVELVLARKRQEILINKLRTTLEEVRSLRQILPICSNCKKVRDDEGYWQNVEQYMSKYRNLEFSHGLCPDCFRELYPEYTKDEE
jgi:DNA-binding response OmpR family regulator